MKLVRLLKIPSHVNVRALRIKTEVNCGEYSATQMVITDDCIVEIEFLADVPPITYERAEVKADD